MPEVKKLVTAELNPPMNITVVREEQGLEELVGWLLTHPEFGFDLETNPLKQFFMRKTRLMQFGDRDKQWVVDLRAFVDSPDQLSDAQGNYGARLHEFPRLQKVIQSIAPFIESALYLKVGVNLGFEYMQMYWGFGLRLFNIFDCQMCERVIQAGNHSLKDYDFYSMESLMARYFGVEIDKELQISFDLDNVLTEAQYEYAALDTRFPFPVRKKQLIIGERDKLLRVFAIENNAVGSFAEMHVHGEKLDTAKWTENTNAAILKRNKALATLDEMFLKYVPNKNTIITDQMVEDAKLAWKKYTEVTPEELAAKSAAKKYEKEGKFDGATESNALLTSLTFDRLEKKEKLKKEASDLGKQRTLHNKLFDKCQGNALINYDSNAQVYKILVQHFKGLSKLKSTNDIDLNKFKNIKVIETLRDYREWDKRVKTYGETWVKEWTTRPCNDEGWISPYTHLLHSVYNQLEAETGRSSSNNPNGQNLPHDPEVRQCFIAGNGLVYVTCDMSGAELRIIAELAKAKTWIEAFKRGEDVHSVCTEILFPKEWKHDQIKSVAKPDGWTLADCKTEKIPQFNADGTPLMKKGEQVLLPPCAFFALRPDGSIAKQKCKCIEHLERRDKTKSLNFGIAYGMGARTLAERTGMSLEEAETIMALHQERFPDIWAYLTKSGILAKSTGQARDMYGRRRSFPEPTQERAKEKYIEDWPDRLELPDEVCEANIAAYIEKYAVKPKGDTRFWLTHREPTSKEIIKSLIAMQQSVERQGKNHCIQGTNASIAKLSLGAGYDPNGVPYLFHILPKYGAKIIKFVHDEIVVRCKPEVAQKVAEEISSAFRRAAAEVMFSVVMEAEFKISSVWEK